MTTGTGADHGGYVHQAVIYDSDEGLLRLVVPHVDAAVAVGQPVLAALPEPEAALVRSALSHPSNVRFQPPPPPQERPATHIKNLLTTLEDFDRNGTDRVHILTTIPHPGLGVAWDGWCRYEAAVNELLREFPLWGLCLYDQRITPHDVLDDVIRTHPRLATLNGDHQPNDRYRDPQIFLRSRPPPPSDPLEQQHPAVELVNPSPAAGRQAVRDLGGATELPDADVADLLVATSEVITNALVHGQPPVIMKGWAAANRIVITVIDHGQGPQDPYVGLVPRPSSGPGGGLGLWIANQLATTTLRRDGGFTVRLIAGTATP